MRWKKISTYISILFNDNFNVINKPFLTVLSSAFTNVSALGEDACPPIAKIINLMLKL